MNFITVGFLRFLLGFVVIYYLLPSKYRYIAIFIGSYIFYGSGHPEMLVTLAAIVMWVNSPHCENA